MGPLLPVFFPSHPLHFVTKSKLKTIPKLSKKSALTRPRKEGITINNFRLLPYIEPNCSDYSSEVMGNGYMGRVDGNVCFLRLIKGEKEAF